MSIKTWAFYWDGVQKALGSSEIYFNTWYKLYMYVNSCKLQTSDCLLYPHIFICILYTRTVLCLLCVYGHVKILLSHIVFIFPFALNLDCQPRYLMDCWATWLLHKQKVYWHHWGREETDWGSNRWGNKECIVVRMCLDINSVRR